MSPSVEVLLKYAKHADRFDRSTGLHTFVLAFYAATAPRDRLAEKRTLQLLLEHFEPLANNENWNTVLDILFRSPACTDKLDMLDLALLFLEYLPDYKRRERKLLTSIMTTGEIDDIVNDVSARRRRLTKRRGFSGSIVASKP